MRSVWLFFIAAHASLVAAGCHGCKKEPKLTLTYDVDVDAPYADRPTNADAIMKAARKTLSQRLEPVYRRDVTVATRGKQIVITLPHLEPQELTEVESIVQRSGRVAVQRVDEVGNPFASLVVSDFLEEGISISTEQAPDGLDPDGHPKSVTATYAEIMRGAPKHRGETIEQCRLRFETWTRTLHIPADREIVLQRTADVSSARSADGGWRTFYVVRPAELTNDAISDARTVGDSMASPRQYLLALTLTPDGASRFATLTSANVRRRIAMVVDRVVNSAPVVASGITGGRVSLTMGAGTPEAQRAEAERLEVAIRFGALPAPLHFVSVDSAPTR